MNSNTIIKALAFGALFCATPAFAQSSAAVDVQVSLRVAAGCSINGSGTGGGGTPAVLDFGTIQNAGAQQFDLTTSTISAGSTPIEVSCNVTNPAATIALSEGQNLASGSRRLANAAGTQFVAYRVYQNSDFTGELPPGTPQPISITSGTFDLPLFARILASDVRTLGIAGDMTDLATITLTF